MNLDMDRQIHEIAAVCDYVQGLRRSSKRLWLSFDEWNVWYRARSGDGDRRPPRHRAAAARRGLQPRGRAARRRLPEHAAAELGSGARRLPRPARQCHRAARGQRDAACCARARSIPYAWALRYARGRVLDLRDRVRDISDHRRRPAGRLRPQRPRCRSSTSWRPWMRRTARRAC